jgi:hypothetical protein
VDATVIAIHQHDWFILSSILDDKNRTLLEKKISYLEEIKLLKRLSDLKDPQDYDTKLSYPISVRLFVSRNTKTENRTVTFSMERSSLEEPWTLDLENLINQIK